MKVQHFGEKKKEERIAKAGLVLLSSVHEGKERLAFMSLAEGRKVEEFLAKEIRVKRASVGKGCVFPV